MDVRDIEKNQRHTSSGAGPLAAVVVDVETGRAYRKLEDVLIDAYLQAAKGKGQERHGERNGETLPFNEQPMQALCDLYGRGFALGQAAKKAQEAQRLPYAAARKELLGGIVYLAGAIIHLDAEEARRTASAGAP